MDTTGKTITCRAAIAWEANKPLKIEQIEVAPPKEGEVRIKMMYTAICHTDQFQLTGKGPNSKFPTILGHEGAGVVESVGPGVDSVKPGDHVIPLPLSQCRKCANCMDPKRNLCEKFMYFSNEPQLLYDGTVRFTCRGQPIYHFLGCSTFSEYTVTPEIAVAKVDPAVALDKVALLGCGVTTGYGAPINGCPVTEGSTVGVWGLGAIGMAVLMGARDRGARTIVAIDPNPDRRKLAPVFGATEVVNPKEMKEPLQQYFANKFNGGLDFAFECVGNVDVMRQAFECTNRYGQTCILGVSEGDISIPVGMLLQARSIVGCCVGGWKTRDALPMLADKYKNGKLKLDEFISWRCSLDEINTAWEKLERGDGIRTIIKLAKE